MNRNVGRVLDEIQKGGRANDTIVVFTSDNGGERFSKTWPFTGRKGELLEGGIRTLLIVRWPQRIAQGQRSAQLAITMDWVPTLLEAAGVEGSGRPAYDGISLLPGLLNSKTQPRTVFWRHFAHSQRAVRQGRWKYLKMKNADYLFDIVSDPMERANKKDLEPKIFASLKDVFSKWDKDMIPYPEPTPSWDNKRQNIFADRY